MASIDIICADGFCLKANLFARQGPDGTERNRGNQINQINQHDPQDRQDIQDLRDPQDRQDPQAPRDLQDLQNPQNPQGLQKQTIVVVAGATGVPQRFYEKFAIFLQNQGNTVITFDYRGIGESKVKTLKGFEADFLTWALQDLAAVVDWALERGQTVLVGHSFGGQAFGLVPRCNELLGLYSFGAGAGWYGYMPFQESLRALFLWHVIGPLLVAKFGYLPLSKLNMGEDIPVGVYRQWKRWCSFPNYFFGDPQFEYKDRCSRVSRPIVAVTSTDDSLAPPRSVSAFFSGYTNAAVLPVSVSPQSAGVEKIGHMGYFRSACASTLWKATAQWIADQH